ncbi:hypothetical protein [Xanthobacter sp. NM-44]|nr:hypothetical protein [Xanthobacter sp. NM-44]
MSGCYHCGGADARWHGKNALALAARHHDSTGHTTWCEQVMSVRYGPALGDDTQPAAEPVQPVSN